MLATEPADLLADFESGRIDPASFPHRDHVRVSYELLERHHFTPKRSFTSREVCAGWRRKQGNQRFITRLSRRHSLR